MDCKAATGKVGSAAAGCCVVCSPRWGALQSACWQVTMSMPSANLEVRLLLLPLPKFRRDACRWRCRVCWHCCLVWLALCCGLLLWPSAMTTGFLAELPTVMAVSLSVATAWLDNVSTLPQVGCAVRAIHADTVVNVSRTDRWLSLLRRHRLALLWWAWLAAFAAEAVIARCFCHQAA
jgi:hypothetical protein